MGRPRRELTDAQEDVLNEIEQAAALIRRTTADRDHLVRVAVEMSVSWREIGAALCISPQAAHERYGPSSPA